MENYRKFKKQLLKDKEIKKAYDKIKPPFGKVRVSLNVENRTKTKFLKKLASNSMTIEDFMNSVLTDFINGNLEVRLVSQKKAV